MKPNKQIKNLERQLAEQGVTFDPDDQWEKIGSGSDDELRLFRYAELLEKPTDTDKISVAITASKITGYWHVEILKSWMALPIPDSAPLPMGNEDIVKIELNW